MNRTANTFFLTGAIFAVIGMAWGIQMSATHDHTLSPAHAHLNLLGFLVMAVYGTFYALDPMSAESGLAKAHYLLALVATLVIAPGIAIAISTENPLLAQIGSILTIAAMLLFVWVIFRARRA